MYNFIFHIVMVMWSLAPHCASICDNEVLFVAEAVFYKLELILEMEYVQGSIICSYLLQPSIVGIMVCLEVFIMCLML